MTTGKRTTVKRVALYLRVSTDRQTTDNQRRQLRRAARDHGWQVVATFEDAGISGAAGRNGRPAYDDLLKGVARREFDMVAAWSVDRLGRSLQDLVGFLGELHAKGVDLYLHRQGLDTSTPAGKAMFQMIGVFAEFERTMIQERVKAGLERARARGRRLGRPATAAKKRGDVLKLRRKGLSIRAIAGEVGISPRSVQRLIQAAAA